MLVRRGETVGAAMVFLEGVVFLFVPQKMLYSRRTSRHVIRCVAENYDDDVNNSTGEDAVDRRG